MSWHTFCDDCSVEMHSFFFNSKSNFDGKKVYCKKCAKKHRKELDNFNKKLNEEEK